MLNISGASIDAGTVPPPITSIKRALENITNTARRNAAKSTWIASRDQERQAQKRRKRGAAFQTIDRGLDWLRNHQDEGGHWNRRCSAGVSFVVATGGSSALLLLAPLPLIAHLTAGRSNNSSPEGYAARVWAYRNGLLCRRRAAFDEPGSWNWRRRGEVSWRQMATHKHNALLIHRTAGIRHLLIETHTASVSLGMFC